MRIVRFQVNRTADHSDPSIDHPKCRQETAIEGRLVLNRIEAKALDVALWVRNWWFENVICALGRLLCRGFRRHNVTCRGRQDHTIAGVGIIDPDRWGWPRR